MKKLYLFIGLSLINALGLMAQPLKFKVGLIDGPTSNSMDIVIRPNINFTGYPTNVIFILQIDQSLPQPVITKTSLSPYFVFSADLPTIPNEIGYTTYGFASVNSSNSTNISINAGQDYPILRLTFGGPNVVTTNIRLSHLAGGGVTTLYQNYVEVNAVGPGVDDYTDYVQMFFGSVIQPPSPFGDENTGYTSYQYVQRSQILPVNWLSFSATKQGNNGLLNWRVANEGKCDHYDVFRSTNGTDFTKFGTVSKSAAANGSYSFTDLGINSFSSSIVYYRIMQVDVDGGNSNSEIKHIDIDKAGVGEITIFPNPVKDGFYVNVPLTKETEKQKVTLNLYGTNGQIITSKEITAQQAANYYFDITDRKLASGQYNLQIIIQDKKVATKMLTINQ